MSRAPLLPAALAAGRPGPAGAAPRPTDADRAEWVAFQSRFLAPEGRVVDTGNDGISHSEGQGWALLFAARMDDQPGFERILGWTRARLRRPEDELHSWRFRPWAARPVDDPNNATDGDICIAWALLEAGARWGRADHVALGTAIAQDILRLLVRRAGAYTVLLPGAQHFDRAEQVILNPSYYIFPAFGVLARAVPDPAWVRLAADGIQLLRAGRFGRWGLLGGADQGGRPDRHARALAQALFLRRGAGAALPHLGRAGRGACGGAGPGLLVGPGPCLPAGLGRPCQ